MEPIERNPANIPLSGNFLFAPLPPFLGLYRGNPEKIKRLHPTADHSKRDAAKHHHTGGKAIIADELETGFTTEEQARAIAAVQFHAGIEIAAISETMNE